MPRWTIVLVAAAVVVCVVWLVFGTGEVPEPPAEPAQVELGPVRAPVHLELAAAISGHVRDEHGRGIADATVCASGEPPTDRGDLEAPACVLSDAGGGYRIDQLWPVPYTVDASASRFEPTSSREVALRAGQEATGIDVILHSGVDQAGVSEVLEGALARVGGVAGDPGFTTGAGLVVTSVRADGPAAQAGLQVGDVIVSLEGHTVTGDRMSLFHSLVHAPAGTRLQLGLARGVTLALTLAAPR